MLNKKIRFRPLEEMRSKLYEIIGDSPLVNENVFNRFFLKFAGKEADLDRLIFVFIFALGKIRSGPVVNVEKYLDALVDDPDIVSIANKRILCAGDIFNEVNFKGKVILI